MTDVDGLTAALADRYRFDRELGGGGMSRVFLAHELALDRQVVVKVVSSELTEGLSAERFAREVRLAAKLQHANIVPVLAAGVAAGLSYYTMPFVVGQSLRARLVGGTPLPVAETVAILRDVARALAYAHSEGIVHRDIKPENVLLSHGAAMVTDFGIAKALTASRTAADVSVTLTQAGGAIGTPAYMAPEQAVGDTVDHRADLYAWGLLGYEMLTGGHPFARHATPQQLVAAHLTEAPAALGGKVPSVPPALTDLVMRCLEKDPARRPASATDLLAVLDGALTPGGSLPPPAAASAARRYRAVIVVVAIAAIAAAGWALRGRTTAAPPAGSADESVAVLPLANLSGDKNDDYFGIGLAEEITRAVAQNGVRVIGRMSAGALQAKGLDDQAIARELGVSALLTGTVQRAQNQVRINVSLISARDGSVRWTEKYDRPLTNVFAVQDEIARTVAATLLGRLTTRSGARAETADPEAHALFLQGRVLFNRRGAGPIRQAITLFHQALARDPRYARAQASLAMAYAVLPAYVQDSTPEILTSAVAAAERAIAMDSTIAESFAALGYASSLLGDLPRAEASFRRGIALDSTLATTWGWYGLLANRRGDFRAAHERMERGRQLEPASLIARVWIAQAFMHEGRFAEADSIASEAMAMDSTFMLAWTWRGNALLAMKRYPEALALIEGQVGRLPAGRPEEAHGLLAYGYAVAGRTREARALLDTLRIREGGQLPRTGVVAAALEALGDHPAAVRLLEQAIGRHDVWVVQFPQLARYDELRKDPKAAAMLAALR